MVFPIHLRILYTTYRLCRRISRIAAMLFLLFLLTDLLFPIKIPNRYSTLVYAADGTILHTFLSEDQKWRMDFELDEITPEIKKAFIAKEDQYYYQHPGINPFAVLRAATQNLLTGRRHSGASTITMQVARLIEPRPRTITSKLIETFRAFQLEWHCSKDEILRQYLNLVPCGGNIEGIKAGSLMYFGKLPDRLSLAEITTLTIIPNRPGSLRPGKDNAYLQEERNRWLTNFKENGDFPAAQIQDAQKEPLVIQRREHPAQAPHLAIQLHHAYPEKTTIRTTIDPEKQIAVEQLITAHLTTLRDQDVSNAAVVVINNNTQAVEAYAASHNFSDAKKQGQVDGLRAIRSPGSALKPLLYALAADQGKITPKTILQDIPVNFSGYEPDNYDGGFRGPVTAEQALSWSLNIPAVRLLNEITVSRMVASLSKADFETIRRQEKDLGLSLALGGCGVTPLEMAGLYSTFAHQGAYKPLRFCVDDPTQPGRPIFSPQSAWMITEMLTQTDRPDLPLSWQASHEIPQIAWKTGTSYGRRDAWSIGYNPRYTVLVWLGKFTGEPIPALSGAESATPLLFRIFREIDREQDKQWYSKPANIEPRLVCAASGKPPGTLCQQLVTDFANTTLPTPKRCNHLIQYAIEPDSSFSYCKTCCPQTGYKEAIFHNTTPELAAWYVFSHTPIAPIPPHNPKCERIFRENGPRITSPVEGMDYWVIPSDSMKIALSCQVESDVKTVVWYINDRFYATAKAGEPLFCVPNSGRNKITCTDEKGRKNEVTILVKQSGG